MTIDQHTAIARLTPIGVTLKVKNATITLDERWSPYCQVQLTCSMPSSDDRATIDLRTTSLRLDLRLRQDFGAAWSLAQVTADFAGTIANLTTFFGGQALAKLTNRYYMPWNGIVRQSTARTFDLLVTSRQFDDEAQELTLIAQSNEAKLLGDAWTGVTAYDPGTTSVKAIAQAVLARYGYVLSTSALDATVSVATATVWKPGVSALRYLDALLEPASLRLWCDEAGVWTITTREATIAGSVLLAKAKTMTGHKDKMTLSSDTWYDAVVVEYRWTDDAGVSQVSYDTAGASPAKSTYYLVRDNTRYPGPGAAAGMLSRAQGRGRVLDITAISDYTVSPGMATTITPPDTVTQTGYLSAVSWSLPRGEMDITNRGLVDTPSTAYLFGAAGKRYTDVPVAMSYNTFDWSGF